MLEGLLWLAVIGLAQLVGTAARGSVMRKART